MTMTTFKSRVGADGILIADIARTNGAMLVTRNTREFTRVPGLIVDDWETT